MCGIGGLGIFILRSFLDYFYVFLKVFGICVLSVVISIWYILDNNICMFFVFIFIVWWGWKKYLERWGDYKLEWVLWEK